MKFKDGLRIGAQISLIFNAMFSIVCFGTFLFDRNVGMLFYTLLIFTIVIWFVYFVCILFTKTIYITEEYIMAKRFNRTVWVIQKEEITKIEYNIGNVFDVILGDVKATSIVVYAKANLPCLQKKFYKLDYLTFFCERKELQTIKEMGYEILINSRIKKR